MQRLYFNLLVALQFAALVALGLTGPLLAPNLWLGAEGVGALLGLWAIWSMKLGNFNVSPQLRKGAILVQRGPYRAIRHPMYTALLLMTSALVLGHFSWLRLLLWAALALVLQLKLRSEEHLLQARFANYGEYQQRTKRLIPFIY